MAGHGPAPKPPSQRRRRNRAEPLTLVSVDGNVYGPDLPDSHEWPAATLRWWDTWRRCAQASRFTDTDWSFLVDTAVLHAEFWLGDRSVAGELRLWAAKFGATPEDRARLRLEVGDPDGAPKGQPARLVTKTEVGRRDRLLGAVQGTIPDDTSP
jgi:hypothetical protein